ncbi:hypothetical protein ACLOAU_14500 [Niabella sp. CJ426]|uniref:hypothetical protein n=1 Tax=Niabella sp. CJ426 TaxID=3393740 RepID=UPI003D04F2F4
MNVKAILLIDGHVVKSHETWVTDTDKYDRKKAIEKFVSDFKCICRSKTEKYDYEIHIQFESKMNKNG